MRSTAWTYILFIAFMVAVLWGVFKCADTTYRNEKTKVIHREKALPKHHLYAEYDSLITANSELYRVPQWMIRGIIHTESRGVVDAVSGQYQGLMGLGEWCRTKYKCTDGFAASENIRVGTNYLSDLYEQYRDWDKVLSAYNSGQVMILKTHYINLIKTFQDE